MAANEAADDALSGATFDRWGVTPCTPIIICLFDVLGGFVISGRLMCTIAEGGGR